MRILLKNLTKKDNTYINVDNCSITLNSKHYVIKDDKAVAYDLVDGKPDKNSAEAVNSISVYDYQAEIINKLKSGDGDQQTLSKADLAGINPADLQKELREYYAQRQSYTLAGMHISDETADFGINEAGENADSSRIFGIDFSEDKSHKNIFGGMALGGGLIGTTWLMSHKNVRKSALKGVKKGASFCYRKLSALSPKAKLITAGVLAIGGAATLIFGKKNKNSDIAELSEEYKQKFDGAREVSNKKTDFIKGCVLGGALAGGTWAMTKKPVRSALGKFFHNVSETVKPLLSKIPAKYKWIGAGAAVIAGAVIAGVSISDKKKTDSVIGDEWKQDDLIPESDKVFVDEPRTITVGKNDSLYAIAKKYGVSIVRLQEANPQIPWEFEWGKNELGYYETIFKGPNELKDGTTLYIPATYRLNMSKIKNVSDIAEAAGVSEKFIRHELMEKEGTPKGDAVLTTYLDSSGVPTIGYGHTGSFKGKPLSMKNPIKITKEEALQLLAHDILIHKLDAVAYAGKEDFYKAPLSVQESMINISFWRGIHNGFVYVPNSPTNNFKESLHEENRKPESERDYGKVAANLNKRCTGTAEKGLTKRAYHVVMWAIEGLDTIEEKKSARDDFKETYDRLCKLYGKNRYNNGDFIEIDKRWSLLNLSIKLDEVSKIKNLAKRKSERDKLQNEYNRIKRLYRNNEQDQNYLALCEEWNNMNEDIMDNWA